jgi:hypothetical protein
VFGEKSHAEGCDVYTTTYLRAFHDERPLLFQKLHFCGLTSPPRRVPKIQHPAEQAILRKVTSRGRPLGSFFSSRPTKEKVYYRRLGNFFFKLAFTKPPLYKINGAGRMSSTVEELYLTCVPATAFTALVNSTLMFWYWNVLSNVMDFKAKDIRALGFDYEAMPPAHKAKLEELGGRLLQDLEEHKTVGVERRRNGDRIEAARYWPQHSKPIADEIDKVLADYYGLDDGELDFIVNYEIKYRMGRSNDPAEGWFIKADCEWMRPLVAGSAGTLARLERVSANR